MHEQTGYLAGQGGVKLFYRVWTPAEPKGSIVLVHGVNEHSGRYEHVAAHLCDLGLAVYALDHRGHGRSEGVRCYINRFDEYVQDVRQLVEKAAEHGKPLMLGHSMGGLIAFRYAVAFPETLSGLILSSPFFRAKVKPTAVQQAILPLVLLLAPRLPMAGGIGPEDVSRHPDVVKAYATDPLVGKTVTPRWFAECTRAAEESMSGLAVDLKLPVLFLQAGSDKLVDPDATRQVYSQVAHERKAFKLYPELYHEIMNEPERGQVLADVTHWLHKEGFVSN